MLTVRWLDEAQLEAEETARYYAEIDLDLAKDLWSQVRKQCSASGAWLVGLHARRPHRGRVRGAVTCCADPHPDV